MKRRLTPIVTVSLALLLIGSLAYAADRKKQSKQVRQPADPVHEEETIRAELLAAVDDNDKKQDDAAIQEKADAKKAVTKNGRVQSADFQ